MMAWFLNVEGMIKARGSGAIFAWRCHGGCPRMQAVDLDEYLSRCGATYSLHNEVSVCGTCGSPTTVMKSPQRGTPLTPMKDEDLWIVREVRLGDPEEWFEIDWMDGGVSLEPRRKRRR
jgi:hypothetical protein